MLKKRWRSLRDCFIKYYKLEKSRPSGSAGGKRRKWTYYENLLFLIPHVEFKETIGSFIVNEDEVTLESVSTAPSSSSTNNLLEENIDSQVLETPIKKPSGNKTTKLQRDIDMQLMEIIKKPNDADELFLLSCLPALKSLCPRKNMMAKMKIQKILFDFQFGDDSHPMQFSKEDTI